MIHKNLTVRLLNAELKWSLEIGQRFGVGARSDVFASTMPQGQPVVLKFVSSARQAEIEASALKSWAATGASVWLIDADYENGALLLHRLRPGTPLHATVETDTVSIVIGILKALHSVPAPHTIVPTIKDMYPVIEQRVKEDAQW